MRLEKDRLIWTGIRGMNSADSPVDLRDDECVAAVNVDFYAGGLCRRRYGASHVDISGTDPDYPRAAVVHLPRVGGESAAELLAYNYPPIGAHSIRLLRPSTGIYNWVTPTTDDAPAPVFATVGAALGTGRPTRRMYVPSHTWRRFTPFP